MPKSKFSPEDLPNLKGKVYLVTGGNAGIGKATVAGLASQGAKVYMGARSESKARAAIDEITGSTPGADIHFLQMDLARLQTVVAAAQELRQRESQLHGLINNAGIMGVPFAMTEDGIESQFQVNYVAHWLLTHYLLPLLTATAASGKPGDVRIVNLTSDGHQYAPPTGGINFDDINLPPKNSMRRYGQSKLANVLHAKKLNRLYGPSRSSHHPGELYVAAVHPGHIDTHLNKQATGMAPSVILRTATPIMRCLGILDQQSKGAWSSLWVIASTDFSGDDSGAYVVPYAKIGKPSPFAEDEALADKLWTWTENILSKKNLL